MAKRAPEADSLPTPSMLDDRYRVDKLLAVGGMGAIYKGRHTKLRKTVAIKVLKRNLIEVPELVERFQREAVAASQIGHEGIVEVTDIGNSAAGDPFLVMEYLQGEDLSQCLRNAGTFLPATAARLCIEILEALAAAHDKDIIHRDLKPENVFVARGSRGEKLKILDFGISRMPATDEQSLRLTGTGLVMGTPYYMSPEQALGDRNVGKLADIYTVGVILYELVTGALPFRATNYNALLHQILDGEFEKPSLLATVSPEFEALILKGMAFRQEERYPSARAFAEALRPFAEDVLTPLLPEEQPEPDTLDDEEAILAAGSRPGRKRLSTAEEAESVAETQLVDSSAMVADRDDATSDTMLPPPPGDTLEPQVTPAPIPASATQRPSKLWLGLVVLLGVGGAGAYSLMKPGGETRDAGAPSTPPPTAAAPAAPEQPASEPPAAAPTAVTIDLAVAPEGARVLIDGTPVDGARLELPSRDEERVIEVSLDGFQSETRTISGNRDHSLAIALQAQPASSPPKAKQRNLRRKTRASTRREERKAAAPQTPSPTPKSKSTKRRFVEDSPYD